MYSATYQTRVRKRKEATYPVQSNTKAMSSSRSPGPLTNEQSFDAHTVLADLALVSILMAALEN